MEPESVVVELPETTTVTVERPGAAEEVTTVNAAEGLADCEELAEVSLTLATRLAEEPLEAKDDGEESVEATEDTEGLLDSEDVAETPVAPVEVPLALTAGLTIAAGVNILAEVELAAEAMAGATEGLLESAVVPGELDGNIDDGEGGGLDAIDVVDTEVEGGCGGEDMLVVVSVADELDELEIDEANGDGDGGRAGRLGALAVVDVEVEEGGGGGGTLVVVSVADKVDDIKLDEDDANGGGGGDAELLDEVTDGVSVIVITVTTDV